MELRNCKFVNGGKGMQFRSDLSTIKVSDEASVGLIKRKQVVISNNKKWNLKPGDIIEWDGGMDCGRASVIKAGGRNCTIQIFD